MTREVVEILELRQKRCGLRFGIGACPAVIGPKVPAKCLNTYATCPVKAAYDPTGQVRWLFTKPGMPVPRLTDLSDPDDILTNAYPVLRDISFTTKTKMNPGGSRDTESPFGVFGSFTARLTDFTVKDDVADPYAGERNISGSFWGLFRARLGEAYSQLEAYIYRGYRGQDLSTMQVMRYDVQSFDAKVGECRIEGRDPTARTAGSKAQFPRASDLQLVAAIDAVTTVIQVGGTEADLSAVFGNVAGRRAIRIGTELIEYTGHTALSGVYTLTGVVRGIGGTVAASHAQDDLCQRAGWYREIPLYLVGQDLMENHAGLNGLVDAAAWAIEGGRYLPTLRVRETFVTSPVPVQDLMAEIMRDGMFSAWWDAIDGTIPLLAVRPPMGAVPVLSDRAHIIAPGVDVGSNPDDRITRVVIYYNQVNPTTRLDEKTNYRNGRLRVIGGLESPNYADGTVRERAFYSRWISTNAQALLVGASLLRRFGETPKYATAILDAKDRGVRVGDVISLDTYSLVDAWGNKFLENWQVISRDEPIPGHNVQVVLQTSEQAGRFAIIMANDAPDYADATAEERLSGCWLADDLTGLMPNGDDPYLIQ
jgi:hypothetical protein